jgi:hypothetical protein
MKEKYKNRIHQFAENSLKIKLDKEIGNIFSLPDEIDEIIKNEIEKFPLLEYESIPDSEIGNKLQLIGKDIASKIIDKIILECLENFKDQIVKKKERLVNEKNDFYKNKSNISKIDTSIKELSIKIIEYKDEHEEENEYFWSGADVIITPNKILPENLSWNHEDDIQLITNKKELAIKLSYLFKKITEIMNPFLDYSNKYYFYGELAKYSNMLIEKNIQDEEIINNLLLKVIEIKNEFQLSTSDYFSKEFEEIDETIDQLESIRKAENWILNY